MLIPPLSRDSYTKIFLSELGKPFDKKNLVHHTAIWWYNTRSKTKGGLRLTDEGFAVLTQLSIETFDVTFCPEFKSSPKVLLLLDSINKTPYYIAKQDVILTDPRMVVELSLFNNDFEKYGLAKALARGRTFKSTYAATAATPRPERND